MFIDADSAELPGECRAFPGLCAAEKALFLKQCGVGTLICGALSTEYEEALADQGIESISFIAGPVERVLEAWRSGTLEKASFSMPGCGCPRRRRCGKRRHGGSLPLNTITKENAKL
jgi:predicted Fe-Mo cluster-binding NifX family protein